VGRGAAVVGRGAAVVGRGVGHKLKMSTALLDKR
jgi:hypothetical protein